MYRVDIVRMEGGYTMGAWDRIEDARKAGEMALYYDAMGKEARIYHCLNCIEVNTRNTWRGYYEPGGNKG